MSTRRLFAVLLVSCCTLLSFAGTASAREVLLGADGARGRPSNLFILNPSNGSVVQDLGPIGFAVTGLAEDPATGTLYGSTSQGGSPAGGAPNPGSLITINKATGAGTGVGDLGPTIESAPDITFTPNGTLFGWTEFDDDLATIDKNTGAGTIVGDSGVSTYGSGFAADSAGTLFLAGEGEAGPLRTVNPATGLTAQIATLNGNATTAYPISALAFNGAGTLFGVRLNFDLDNRPTDLITINTATGAITSLGPSVDRLDAIEFANVQSTRTVTFDATKAKKGKTSAKVPLLKVQKGKKAKFLGQVSAPQDAPGCQANQTVELQRKKPTATTFTTFETLQTDAAGSFSTKEKIKKTFQWQVVLTENQNCDDATSNSEKVKAKKKKK